MSFKILVSDPLAKEGVEILKEEKSFKVDVRVKLPPEELKKIIKSYDALIVRSGTRVTKDIINHAEKLKIIGRAGVGLDNVDVSAASKKGIIVMNTPGGNTISTAEHTMSLILALSRNIPQATASLKKGEWERKRFTGVELYGKTLGVIGFGRIGSEVAKRALSFNMKVLVYDPFLSQEKVKALGVESADLKDLFKKSDYITVHTPFTKETHHIINESAIKKMKQGVRIINCARGGIVDENALARAIESGRVAGAALDVYENEPPKGSKLVAMQNVITTPHLGASTEEAQLNVAVEMAHVVKDALLQKGIRNAVNVPSVDPEILKRMKPYLELAEKIGSMQAQLVDGYIKDIKIKYVGDILQHDLDSTTRALVKGVLRHMLEENVNYVNSLVIAKERGIKVTEKKTAEIEDFANLIICEVQTNKMKNMIIGTLFTKVDPRLIKINDFYVDAVPEHDMLIIYNKDLPGIVGQIGTILGKEKINIAGLSFGRVKQGGRAITVLNIDSPVPARVLKKIRDAKHIQEVRVVKL